MKKLESFYLGEEIPSNAKHVDTAEISDAKEGQHRYVFFYEVPVKAKTSAKKETNEKETIETIDRVIKYLNAKTGSKFTSKAKAHASKIRARLNEGATPEQFKECIDNMCAQWLEDNKMRSYLRPETLFSNKFWGYITAKSGEQMTQDAFDELDALIEDVGNESMQDS